MRYQSKYYNIKTKTSDGIVFDSHKEARRWEQLLLLQKAGKITSLKRQVSYELVPAQYETRVRFSEKTGKRLKDEVKLVERGVFYVADFVYTDVETGENIVEDVKSEATKTPEFIIKKKLMLAIHGIKVKLVEQQRRGRNQPSSFKIFSFFSLYSISFMMYSLHFLDPLSQFSIVRIGIPK